MTRGFISPCSRIYPDIRRQGQEAKYTERVISSLSGSGNNLRYFQISTAMQPGNSDVPLVNEQGAS
jgi:S1-C subfamily serine protease